jgi:hypothetical protein
MKPLLPVGNGCVMLCFCSIPTALRSERCWNEGGEVKLGRGANSNSVVSRIGQPGLARNPGSIVAGASEPSLVTMYPWFCFRNSGEVDLGALSPAFPLSLDSMMISPVSGGIKRAVSFSLGRVVEGLGGSDEAVSSGILAN